MHKDTIALVSAVCACLLGANVACGAAYADEADISFTSTVKAKSLRVDVVPHPKVTFHGSANRHTVFDSKRAGFPKPVVAGKTYSNIQINTKIESKFTDPQKGTNNASGTSGSVDGGVGGDSGAAPGAGNGAGADAGTGAGAGAGRTGDNAGQDVQPGHRPQGDK